jgi:hypothetical protein
MTHTTPPLDHSSLPNTDAEFQKYKDARRDGYSIMKALVKLTFETGIHVTSPTLSKSFRNTWQWNPA